MAASGEKFEYTCTLKPETLEIAKAELNEDPNTRLLELKSFRDRLLQYPGLKPSNVSHVYKSAIAFPHSHRDRLGRKVYFIFPGRVDTTHYTYAEVFKTEFLNLTKMIEEEEDQVRGFTLVIDYKDFHMSQFIHLSVDFGRRIGKLWQDAFPARLKNTLLVNEPHFIDLVMGLFTQFMKDKMVSRIRSIGTDMKKMHEYIDPACLPAEYGGTLEQPADPTKWVAEMLKCDHQMEEESKFGFVEYTLSKNNDKKQVDAIDNMAGTFKKLNV